MVITFVILIIADWYLACMCISCSCTFWVVKGQRQGHPSRSKVKYMGQNRSKGDTVFHKRILFYSVLCVFIIAFSYCKNSLLLLLIVNAYKYVFFNEYINTIFCKLTAKLNWALMGTFLQYNLSYYKQIVW